MAKESIEEGKATFGRKQPYETIQDQPLKKIEDQKLTPEEIGAFTKEVYKQCIDKKMTCEDFELFVSLLAQRKSSINSKLYRQIKELFLPTLENID